MDAMIPIEVGEPSTRKLFFQAHQNEENIRVELEMARIKKEATKLQALTRYNTKVQLRAFQPGNLVWQV